MSRSVRASAGSLVTTGSGMKPSPMLPSVSTPPRSRTAASLSALRLYTLTSRPRFARTAAVERPPGPAPSTAMRRVSVTPDVFEDPHEIPAKDALELRRRQAERRDGPRDVREVEDAAATLRA